MGMITNEEMYVHLLDIAMAASYGKSFFADIFVRELRQLLISFNWVESNLISFLHR